jgi:hypothetical protein
LKAADKKCGIHYLGFCLVGLIEFDAAINSPGKKMMAHTQIRTITESIFLLQKSLAIDRIEYSFDSSIFMSPNFIRNVFDKVP